MRSLRREFPLAFFISILVFVILMSIIVISLHTLITKERGKEDISRNESQAFSSLPELKGAKIGNEDAVEIVQIDFGKSILLAEDALQEKKYVRAESILRTLHLFFPQSPTVRKMLGRTFYLSGQYTKAEAVYRKLTSIDPSDAVSLNNLAIVLGKEKNYSSAIKLMKKVIELEPDSVTAEINLAGLYALAGDRKKSKQYFEQAKKKLEDGSHPWQMDPYVFCLPYKETETPSPCPHENAAPGEEK